MTGTRSYVMRPARGLVCGIAALLFSVLIVVEGYSADQNGSQNQGTSPIVFSNMSTSTMGK